MKSKKDVKQQLPGKVQRKSMLRETYFGFLWTFPGEQMLLLEKDPKESFPPRVFYVKNQRLVTDFMKINLTKTLRKCRNIEYE